MQMKKIEFIKNTISITVFSLIINCGKNDPPSKGETNNNRSFLHSYVNEEELPPCKAEYKDQMIYVENTNKFKFWILHYTHDIRISSSECLESHYCKYNK